MKKLLVLLVALVLVGGAVYTASADETLVNKLVSLFKGLTPNQIDDAVAQAKNRLSVEAKGLFPSQIHAPELIPEYTDGQGQKRKWKVIEDVAPSAFEVSKLKPRSFLKGPKTLLSGEAMRRHAVKLKGNLGLADGKRLLAEQDKIPAEFQDFYIPLPGTVLRDPIGDLRVAYLYWHGDRWLLSFRWLGDDRDDRGRFACSE